MKKLNTVLLCLGLGFLIYLIWKIGPGELWREISALGWGLSLMIVVEGAAYLAHAWGWRYCIHDPQRRLRLPRLFGIAMAGNAVNYLTPTGSVGGEVSRAALLSSTHGGPEAASSVVLNKLMIALAHLLVVLVGAVFLFWFVSLPVALWVAMAVTSGLMTVGMVIFLLLQKHGKLGALFRWLAEHKLGGRLAWESAQQVTRVDAELKRFYREHPGNLVWSVAWHAVGHLAALVHVWLFLRLLGQPAPLMQVAAAGFLCLWFDLLTFAIPMNLGTLEASRIVVLKSLGCAALLGLTFGVAIRITQLFWSAFGMLSYAFLVRGRSVAGSTVPPTPARIASPAVTDNGDKSVISSQRTPTGTFSDSLMAETNENG